MIQKEFCMIFYITDKNLATQKLDMSKMTVYVTYEWLQHIIFPWVKKSFVKNDPFHVIYGLILVYEIQHVENPKLISYCRIMTHKINYRNAKRFPKHNYKPLYTNKQQQQNITYIQVMDNMLLMIIGTR